MNGNSWISIMNDYYNCASGLEILPENLSNKKFRDFTISRNKLKTLKNSPRSISGNFCGFSNNIISLQEGPKIVNGYYDCSFNELITLEGAPRIIGQFFSSGNNKLRTLFGGPKLVNLAVSVHNRTTSLIHHLCFPHSSLNSLFSFDFLPLSFNHVQ